VTPLGLALVLASLATQSPATDSLRLLAGRLPESALIVEIRARPLAVREAVTDALARDDLAAARGLAAAYAAAWRDSFLVREVARFETWPGERRAAKVWADSTRRAGVAAYSRAGPAAAIAIWRRALRRARTIGDTSGIAAVLGNIGAGFLREGRLDSAGAYLERSRILAAAVGDIRVEANALGTLAGASADRGDPAGARERYARALALRQRIGDTRGVAADHNNLGLLAQTVGDPDEARRQFEAALELNRRDGRDEVAATNLVNLAGLATAIGDFARAEGLYRDALATWRAREQWADAADALHGLGQLELRRGETDRAREVGVEQQKLGNALGTDVGRVVAAIRLESRAGPEQGDPVGVIEPGTPGFRVVDEELVNQQGRRGCAFEETPGLQVLPSLPVPHRRVGDPLEEMNALDHRMAHVMGPRRAPAVRVDLPHG